MSLTLSRLLAGRGADAIALLCDGPSLTYAELDESSRRLASGLAANGIGRGDRVGVLVRNAAAWPQVLFGCARLGAVTVAVNTRFGSAEIADVVGRSRCKALFVGRAFEVALGGIDPGRLPDLRLVVSTDDGAGEAPGEVLQRRTTTIGVLLGHPAMRDEPAGPDTPCCLFTTSGTTSLPKFVLHKQSALVAHARAAARAFGYLAPDTVTLQATPFCGIYGFTQALATLAAGRPVVLLRTFDAADALRLMAAHRVTQLNGTDEMLRRLLGAAGNASDPLRRLRFFGCALFGPAAADIVAEAESRGVRVRGLYGMSETQALLTLQPDELPLAERMQGGGIAVSGAVTIRARDPRTDALLAHGEPGEIEIRSPGLMVGYGDDPRATAEAFTQDGYFRTGDLGFTRADGGFVFLSRMGDVLRLGGYLVSPREIEAHINTHPGVVSSQVVGVTIGHELRAAAFVIPADGAPFSETVLRTYCEATLARFKVPARIFPLSAFPVAEGPNGRKVQKHRLREWAQAWCNDGERPVL